MGTKRAFDEELQELIKQPRTLDHGTKPDSFAENQLTHETFQVVGIAGESGSKYESKDENAVTVPDTVNKEFDTNAQIPLVTESCTDEDGDRPQSVFLAANLFSEFYSYNFQRRQLFHHDNINLSLLNNPRKEIPIGPNFQAHIPEFDPEIARNYKKNNDENKFLGVCIIPMNFDDDEISGVGKNCECFDSGSIRCVRQHVKESRMKLRENVGVEKFVNLGMLNMGQEVACRWSEEEERVFREVVYLNSESVGRRFWNQLSITFPYKTNKELVSYYFNVFILHRRAVQNRSRFLEIDSDDDEWRLHYGDGPDLAIAGYFGSNGDQSSDDDDDDDDDNDDFVIGPTEDLLSSDPVSTKKSDVTMDENRIRINERQNGQLGSEANSLVLQSTCSIIQEIFGCSKNGNNAIE